MKIARTKTENIKPELSVTIVLKQN